MSAFLTPNRLLQALAEYDFSGKDEQAIREQWIYPLLSLLGYGLGTRNRVDIPFKVTLRPPVQRALGSRRWEIDYRPTVHGVGLWIIEAKRPAEDLFSDQHISQAWGYATHPRVDVPFMALANGERLCLFDVTQDEWDEPLMDVQQKELPSRFAELDAVLGAARVAEFVRRRQLRHLRTALLAQLDDDSLDQTLTDVSTIVDEVRPIVERNRSRVQFEAFEDAQREWDRVRREGDVWGLAFSANSPDVVVGRDIDACTELVRERDPARRAAAFDEMLSAARVRDTYRVTFSLRVLRLAVALRLVGYEGADATARAVAKQAARDAALGFPDDPIAAAAHRFERALPAFLARIVLAHGTDAALAAASEAKKHLDAERWLRENAVGGLGAEARLSRQVDLGFRQVWVAMEPWTAHALDGAATWLRQAIGRVPLRSDVRIGQVNNAFYETPVVHDPLKPGTRNVIWDVAQSPRQMPVEQHSEEAREFAQRLLHTYFDETVEDGPQT